VPRVGLDSRQVVSAAAELIDQAGLAALSLSAVAQRVGIKPPSLYAHVSGLEDLRGRLATRGAEQLAGAIAPAAAGRSRGDALLAVGRAYRAWALEHPGLYALLETNSPRHEPAVARVLELVLAVLRGYGLEGDTAIHAARTVRAAIHGFVQLVATGGFEIAIDLGTSFDWMLTTLDRGFSEPPPA
jgi:AcrR family transcriptional regulator